jgi:uncharacterized protein
MTMTTIPTSVRSTSELELKNIKLNNPILIAGFPGPGLVGSISTSYIIEKLNMHQIACVESEYISPGVIFIDGKLRHPFRLYANEQGDVCVLVCEAPIMIHGIHSVLDTVMKWSIENNINEVLVLEGIPVQGIPGPDRQPIVLYNENSTNTNKKTENVQDIADNMNINSNFNKEAIESSRNYKYTAFIGGISGGLLSACLSYEISCGAILVPASSGIPDPEGAALLIESLDKITDNENLRIDPSQLKKQGVNLKHRLEEVMKSVNEQQQNTPQGTDQQVMYG